MKQFNGDLKRRATQGGMTLMEVLLVISVMAFLIVGGLTLFGQANQAARAQQGQTQLLGLASNVRTMFGGRNNFTGLETASIANAGAAPGDMIEDDGTGTLRLVNVWGGDVDISAPDETAGTCDGVAGFTEAALSNFCISMHEVPGAACVRLVTSGVAGAESGGFVRVTDGTTEVLAEDVTAGVAAGLCDEEDNIIHFMY